MSMHSSQKGRRSFLRESALATAGLAGGIGLRPVPISARLQQGRPATSRGPATKPISRQFAQWSVGLRYRISPPAVVDRVKGLTLQNLRRPSRFQMPGKQAVTFVDRGRTGVERRHHPGERPQGHQGRRRLCELGDDAARAASGTPSACSPIPARRLSRPPWLPRRWRRVGKDFITGVAAGYEVMERMAADLIPTVMARGFHAGPVFSIFGAAVAAAKIMGFTEDQIHAAISLCTNLAGSNLESRALREGAAVRNAMLAVSLCEGGGSAAARRFSKVRPASTTHTPATTGHLTYSFDRRGHQPRPAHRQPRQGLDVARDAVPHLLDCRLQHRAHRRDGEALRGAQHQIRGHRAHRGRGELAGDAISQSRVPARAKNRRTDAGSTHYSRAYGVVKRGFPMLAWSRPIRPRCSS